MTVMSEFASASVAGGTSSGGTVAGAPPSTTSPSSTTAPSTSLADLERQRTEALSRRNQLQDTKRTQETNLQGLREQRAAITGTDAGATAQRTALDAAIRSAETGLAQTTQDLSTTTNQISRLDQDVEKNPEYRLKRIEERYNELKASNKEKNDALTAQNTACQSDPNCLTKTLIPLQITANTQYQAFLDAKKALEVCQLKPSAPCDPEKKALSEASLPLNATIAQLTKLEQEKNSLQTFNVSEVFSPTGEPMERQTFQTIADTVANWMITLVTSLAVTTLIIGGFMMIISGGDENRLEMGKTIFEYSLIGLVVTLMAYGIITFIQSIFYP